MFIVAAIMIFAGIMKNFEGKLPITAQLYGRLLQVSLRAADDRAKTAAFVHPFLALCWNLFARSVNIANLGFHHLSWSNDALVVDFSKQKADQTGSRKRLIKNMLGNFTIGLHRRKDYTQACVRKSI